MTWVAQNQIHQMFSVKKKKKVSLSIGCTSGLYGAQMCGDCGVTDLSWVGPNFAEEGFFIEVHDVVFCILSLHYCTAVSGGQVTLLTTGVHNQFGVLILQPATWSLRYSSVVTVSTTVQRHTSCLNQINKKLCNLTCVSSSRNSSWCWSAARQLLLQWKHQIWARSPGTRMHWLWMAAGALLHDTAVAPATHKWFSETQQRILSSHVKLANPGSTSVFFFKFMLFLYIGRSDASWVGQAVCLIFVSGPMQYFTWIPCMHALTISL